VIWKKNWVGYVGQFEGVWTIAATRGRKRGRIVPGQWQLRILITAPFSGILNFHCLGTILFPLPAFYSCDRPNILKLLSITSRSLPPYHFNIHLKAIQSPWEREGVCFPEVLKHLTAVQCINQKTTITCAITIVRTSKLISNFFLTSFSLRRRYQPESRHQTKCGSVLSSSPNRE